MSLFPVEPSSPTDEQGAPTQEPRLLTRRIDADEHEHTPPAYPRSSFFAVLSRFRRNGPRSSAPSSRRRRFRIFLLALGALTLLAVAGLISTAAWLRHSMRAALPQLDGTVQAAGLSAPVTVTRDAHGVPSIEAANLDDLLFAQGYVTAQDRLWQMDALRRHASGQLAEILGSNLVPHDRLQRTLQLSAAADRALAVLAPDQVHQLDAYASGVNAFLTQNGDRLPVEFHVLHYKPAPWSPHDSLLVLLAMCQDLSTEFPTKMRREALAAHLPAELLADLYPVGSWRDRPPSEPPPDLTVPTPQVEQIPLDQTQSDLRKPQAAAPDDILRIADEFPGQRCDTCRAGSNNWAVAASRSASHAPLVSNDMHLSLAVPDIWYEAGLHTAASSESAGLDVAGFTLPGVPFIVVGRNRHVAWSFTNLGADVQDVRVEHLRGAGSNTEFERADGTWSPVAHHSEHIRVRGSADVDLDVLATSATVGSIQIETPLISGLYPSEHRALSLAWSLYDPANITSPFLSVNTAPDGASLVASLAGFGGVSLNLVYADDGGHIGYHAIGRIPIRGPAEHHPRAAKAPAPVGPAPPDEGTGDDLPQANLALPENTPALRAAAPFSGDRRPLLLKSAFVSRRNVRSSQARKPLAPPAPAAPAEEIIAKPAIDYTIGSPISPLPVDALDSTQIWSGYIPYNELPSIVDPPNGVLATANARIAADDYPYAIALDWAPPYRVERIGKRLAGRTNLTPADMLALQNDVHSEFDLVLAQRISYALDHASSAAPGRDGKRLSRVADILRSWNGEVTPDAVAPTITTAVRAELWPMLLEPQIAAHDHGRHGSIAPERLVALYEWQAQSYALEELLQHTPTRWLPPGFANWDGLIATATERALQHAHAPAKLDSWRFGPTHPVNIGHGLFSISPIFDRILGVATGSGARETSGNSNTVRAVSLNFGPSERFTADLADPQASFANITTGESGNPASPHYFDHFLPWLNGTTFLMPLHATDAAHRLNLTP